MVDTVTFVANDRGREKEEMIDTTPGQLDDDATGGVSAHGLACGREVSS